MIAGIERRIHNFIRHSGGTLTEEPKHVGILVPPEQIGRTIVFDVTHEPIQGNYTDSLMRSWVTAADPDGLRDDLIQRNGKSSDIAITWDEEGATVYAGSERLVQSQYEGNYSYQGLPARLISLSQGKIRLLCVHVAGNDWRRNISPFINTNALVSGNNILGGIFRDRITAHADDIWRFVKTDGKSHSSPETR